MNTKKGNPRIAFFVINILFSDLQGFDDSAISLNILYFEIIEQFPPLTYEFEQGPLSAVVLLIGQQMLGKVIDPCGKNCNLAFS